MLSIIIPTLNEENYLPLLLESIKKHPEAEQSSLRGSPVQSSAFVSGQNFSEEYEIIVADAGSEDKTVEIAKNYGCKMVPGGVPPKGKNEGARAAKGGLFLFVDADVVLPQNFLAGVLNEFNERNLDIASFYLKSENKFHNFLFGLLYNFPVKATQKLFPQAMNIILAKKEVHRKIGGFDEKIKLGEELDYIRKVARIGKFGILKSAKILASARRYQQDGWLKTWFKYFLCQLYMIFLGPVKSDIFKYRFNHYLKEPKKKL